MFQTLLPQRAVIELAGDDRIGFLQGLLSNDVTKLAPGQVQWTAMLSPQGKFQYDLFVNALDDRLLLDVEADRAETLLKRLGMFKLRSKITLTPRPDLQVWALWGQGDLPVLAPGSVVAADPRLPQAGWRALASAVAGGQAVDFAQWDRHRLELGLPDGSRDMQPDHNILLELGFQELHGVDFDKGCYMGQELTARSRYRLLIRRRLLVVAIDGPVPAPGTPVLAGEDEAGHMASAQGDLGLALLRIEKLDQPLTCGAARLTVRVPDWVVLPEQEG